MVISSGSLALVCDLPVGVSIDGSSAVVERGSGGVDEVVERWWLSSQRESGNAGGG